MTIILPASGEQPWDVKLNAAITGIDADLQVTKSSQDVPVMPQVGLYSWDEVGDTHIRTGLLDLGVPTVRIGGNATLTDALWAQLLGMGVQVYYTLGETAARNTFASDNAYITAQLAFADTILQRYGPRGTYWDDNLSAPYRPLESVGVLNEPNFNGVPTPLYGALLVAEYAHIKATWPEVIVVGFQAGGAASAAPGFIQDVFVAVPAAAHSFDVLAWQPYTPNSTVAPEGLFVEDWGNWTFAQNLGYIRGFMKAAGCGNKPIWITETGFQISSTDGGLFTGISNPATLAQQAAYNVRTDLLAARYGMTRVYHMFVSDTDGFNGGYWDGSGTARPVVAATDTLLKLLADADQIAVLLDGSSGVFQYRFHTPRGRVDVVWATTTRTATVRLAGVSAAIIDSTGTQTGIAPSGNYTASLSESPVYFAEAVVELGTGGGSTPPSVTVPTPVSFFDWHEGSGLHTTSTVPGGYTLTVDDWPTYDSFGAIGPSGAVSSWTLALDVTLSGTWSESSLMIGSNRGHFYNIKPDGHIGLYPNYSTVTPVLVAGTRQMVAFVITGGTSATAYIDGTSVGTWTGTWSLDPANNFIVMGDAHPTAVVHGLRYWGSALSPEQVALL